MKPENTWLVYAHSFPSCTQTPLQYLQLWLDTKEYVDLQSTYHFLHLSYAHC